jgi:hypothetical protein
MLDKRPDLRNEGSPTYKSGGLGGGGGIIVGQFRSRTPDL